MKTIAEIRAILATLPTLLTTGQASYVLGYKRVNCLSSFLALHPEYRPAGHTLRTKKPCWTHDNIIAIAEYRIAHAKDAKEEPEVKPVPETTTAISESAPLSPLDMLIAMNEQIEHDKNVQSYFELKDKFEAMNERQLQMFFAELLKRFKFRYIVEQIPELQSQTLTCISKGKLKGIEKYKLDFKVFLKMLKFCADNNCPTDYDGE